MAPIVANPTRRIPAETVRALRSSPAGVDDCCRGSRAAPSRIWWRCPGFLEVQLVGSHGSEFDTGFVHAIDADARKLLDEIVTEQPNAADTPAQLWRRSLASVALHVRNTSADDAEKALIAVRTESALWPGVQVTEGKSVVELAVIATDKGHALDLIRHQDGATAAVHRGRRDRRKGVQQAVQGPTSNQGRQRDTVADHRVDSTAEMVVIALMKK